MKEEKKWYEVHLKLDEKEKASLEKYCLKKYGLWMCKEYDKERALFGPPMREIDIELSPKAEKELKALRKKLGLNKLDKIMK